MSGDIAKIESMAKEHGLKHTVHQTGTIVGQSLGTANERN